MADDILYIRKSLVPVRLMKEQEASRRMATLIVEAMNTKTTQMNDAVHILVHQVRSLTQHGEEKKAQEERRRKNGQTARRKTDEKRLPFFDEDMWLADP